VLSYERPGLPAAHASVTT